MDSPGSIEFCLGTLLFYPRYAGPALRFKRYEPGLRARGIRMRVFSGLWDEDAERLPAETFSADGERPSFVVDGIPVHGVRVSTRRGRRRVLALHARALARFCRRSRPRPDLVQFLYLSHWALEGLVGLRRARIPVVYTHSMLEPRGDSLRERLQHVYDRWPYCLVDCVVVSSGVMRDALREEGVRGRIEVIPNGVDLQRFRPVPPPARRALRQRLGLDPEGELIVFVGGFLDERKGVDVLASAWAEVARARPQARLVLVGPHYDAMRPSGYQVEFHRKVLAKLEGSGARDRVVLTGEVRNVEEYFQAGDLFVFPSRMEGMPNVVPEAFASGVPTVMTPFVGLPEEFGRPGEHYQLVERAPRALAGAIVALLGDLARREQLARQARRWVEDKLDLERSLDSYASLYRELARRPTPSLKGATP